MKEGKLKKKLHMSRVLVTVLAFALVFYSLPNNVLDQATDSAKVMTKSGSTLGNRTSYRVTLVTGDVVTVTDLPRGQRGISVIPADPTELGQNFQAFKIRNDTYVIPSSVDVRKVDVELFNIDLLIREGYFNRTHMPVIVQCESRPDPAENVREVEGKIAALKGETTFKSLRLPAVAADLPREKAKDIFEMLVRSSAAHKIWLDRKVKVHLNESAPLIGAPDVWALGYNGSGIEIAILDTGIDSTHPDFYFTNGTSKIIRSVSFVTEPWPSGEDPEDYMGHGTHCASIAAGSGAAPLGKFKGVAPGAGLWNVKVLNWEGWGYWSWVIAGIEYAAYGPDGVPLTGDEADIISISLGSPPTDGTDPCSLAVDAAVDSGVIVCVAAGNEYDYFWITSPGTARKAITVGASDKADVLAGFTSKGPTVDFRVKPDVLAPGVDIIAARAWNALWPPIPDHSQYCQLSGTSMSTPHVAGAAALTKQFLLTEFTGGLWTPEGVEHVKDALISHAVDLEYNVYEQGGGRIDPHKVIATSSICVHPATISFGAYTTDTAESAVLEISARRAISTRDLTLSVGVQDVVTGNPVDCATLNATTLQIPPGEVGHVLLTLNTTLSKSLYSGRVTINDADGYAIHAIFGFARMNNLTINMMNRDGNPAARRPIQVFKSKATSYLDRSLNSRWIYTDDEGKAYAYVADGSFHVVGLDWEYETQSDVWVTSEVPIYEDTIVTLDERLAHKVDFDPNKPDQIFCSKYSSINYCQEEPLSWSYGWLSLWYYPTTAATYISSTTLNTTFSYEYYPSKYFKPAHPDLIDTTEWHNLLYWELRIDSPIQYKADYAQLVRRVTEYKVGTTPTLAAYIVQHKFDPITWFSVEYVWMMTAPQSRVEHLSSDISYDTTYEKARDPPWIATPYWLFAHLDLKEYYPSGARLTEAFGEHPLSTHFLVQKGLDYLDIITDIFMDTYGHTLWWVDYGRIRVYRDDNLIRDEEIQDFWYGSLYDPRPAHYRVVIEGWSDQYLSSTSHTELEFTVADGVEDYAPPTLYIRIPGLNLNNTHAAGEVTTDIYVDDPYYSSEANVIVEYSIDDGITWKSATPLVRPLYAGVPYPFSLGVLNDTYVSLRVNATDFAGNRISQTTIRGFYVQPFGILPTVDLVEGWNLMSLPLISEDPSIEAVLADIVTDIEVVWSYDAETATWSMYSPAAPEISDLTQMVDGKGYWIKMTAAATLTVHGVEFLPPPALPPAYRVVPGWNLIGFKELEPMKASEYLGGVSYVRLWSFVEGGWVLVGPEDEMKPGLGYWIAVTEEGWIYP